MPATATEPQLDLFLDRPIDPYESIHAVHDLQTASPVQNQRMAVHIALLRFPGSTALELAEHFQYDRYMVSRRLPELEKMGLVYRLKTITGTPETRKCRVGGKPSCIWYVSKKP